MRTLLRADAEKLFGEPDVKKMLSYLVARDMTPQQIAEEYGVTAVSVRSWLRKFSLTPKVTRVDVTERLARLGYSSWNEFFRKNLSMTYVDMAKMLDCHFTTCSKWRKAWVDGKDV